MTARGRVERSFSRAIRDMFLLRTPSALSGELGEHMKVCPSCQAFYRRLALADRLLGEKCGAETALSPLEADLNWRLLAERLQLAPERAGMGFFRPALRAGALAVLLLAGGVLSWLLLRAPGPEDEAFLARGGGAGAAVQTVCIPASGGTARSARQSEGRDACRFDETLGFAYLNPQGRFGGLALFAVDDKGQVLWYVPDPARPDGFAIARADRFQALPRTVRLATNHRPGAYTLVAVFLPRPLGLSEVADQALSLARGATAPEGVYLQRRTLLVEGKLP